jgi:hypothetical protein
VCPFDIFFPLIFFSATNIWKLKGEELSVMITKKRPYTIGAWFGVPLRSGGYARGIVARVGNGGVLFGYFFGPKLGSLSEDLPTGLYPEDRICWGKFGHLGLVKGRWPLLGVDPNWNDEDWPIPSMVRVDEIAGIAFMSKYNDSTMKFISEEKCDPGLVDSHPYDRLMGAGSVEIRLTKLLAGE